MLLFLAKIQESFSLNKALTNYIFTSRKCKIDNIWTEKGETLLLLFKYCYPISSSGLFSLLESYFNPSLIFNCPFFLLYSTLRFSFAALCTTNFSRFWIFWRAFSYTLVVHKYHLRICSARCTVSCGPSPQVHLWLPWWPPSAWTVFGQSLSRSKSLRSAWVCSGWCWLSSMRAGRGRGGRQTCRPSCDV